MKERGSRPESALSSWLDAYRAENERRQEMADAAFSATPLGNLINKSLDAQEKQDKTITLAGDARKQARGAVDEAMASLRLLPSYLRDPLIRHLSFLRKNRKPIAGKAKRAGRRNAMHAEPCAKYSNVWIALTDAG